VRRADQCIGPGPKFRDTPIPTGNCGPVSSDVDVLDGHVRILYEFMFNIYQEIGEAISQHWLKQSMYEFVLMRVLIISRPCERPALKWS
jgi:hypothetical protein